MASRDSERAAWARRAGRIERPDGDGSAGSTSCGDRVRITLRLDGERIADARFAALACPTATAAALWCAEHAPGAFLDAARLSQARCAEELGLEPTQLGCAAVALDALHAALGDAVARLALAPAPARELVALSGGVDSAVALARTVEGGAEAVGVTMRLWIDPEAPSAERACCSPDAVRRARELCHSFGLPHVTLDGQAAFHAAVVDPFVAAYAAGETPNPCTTCNGDYRLHAMLEAADRLGAGTLVTGHYARRVQRGGRTLIARAADPAKDQSYMLGRVPPALTERLRFPLGEEHKRDVRAEAEARGLAAARAPESQDACFLGGGELAAFLERQGVPAAPGEVVDEAGGVLGTHAGAASFTTGQRRGLGIAAPQPLYVLRAEPASGRVVVGALDRLRRERVALRDAVLHVPVERVEAKLRGRSPAVGATVEPGDAPGSLALALDEPAFAVAAGQTAVLYDEGGAVVGSGTIAADSTR